MSHLRLVAVATLLALPPALTAQQATAPARTFYFIVDDLHVEFRDTIRVRALVQRIASDIVHEGDRFAVSSTGSPTIQLDVTTDPQRLTDATTRIAGSALKPYQFTESSESVEIAHRVHVALNTIRELLQNADDGSGPKVVVLISEGYDFDAAQEDLNEEFNNLALEANGVNARFYTLDPRRLVAQNPQASDPTGLAPHRQRMEATLRALSERTGGAYVQTISDLQGAAR